MIRYGNVFAISSLAIAAWGVLYMIYVSLEQLWRLM